MMGNPVPLIIRISTDMRICESFQTKPQHTHMHIKIEKEKEQIKSFQNTSLT